MTMLIADRRGVCGKMVVTTTVTALNGWAQVTALVNMRPVINRRHYGVLTQGAADRLADTVQRHAIRKAIGVSLA